MEIAAARRFFREQFGYLPAHAVRAPGRVELLGHHVEACEGLVLSAALNRHVVIVASPRTDGRIELVTSAFPERDAFWISKLIHQPAAPWADYVKGVLVQLRKRGVHFNGFTAAIHSDIPVGIGLGSSAAVTVATALLIREMYPYSLTELGAATAPRRDVRGHLPPIAPQEKRILARLCQTAEIEFAGVHGGEIEPLSCLLGRAHHVMNFDCRHQTVDYTPLIGEAIVICDPGLRQQRDDRVRESLREHFALAASVLGARSLRSVELPYLKANRGNLNAREFDCAYHVVGEIQRVVFAERALRDDDHRQFGQYLLQSHGSSRDLLRISSPELDLLVDLARSHPACLGACLSEGGLGGATVNLVAYHQAQEFIEFMCVGFAERPGRPLQPIVCQIAEGAG